MAWLAAAASVNAETAPANSDTMLSRPCGQGEQCLHHWTLTSRLGHILESYEAVLGPRNRAYRILGIEFTTAARPGTWYPDFGKGAQSIVVQLTRRARRDPNLALFQLGHEVFHLIEPIRPGSRGSVFEEGLASYFAIDYLERNGITGGQRYITEESYLSAYRMVARLAALHRDFLPRLRRLRERHRSFSKLSSDAIRAAFPGAPAALVAKLARPFGAPATR